MRNFAQHPWGLAGSVTLVPERRRSAIGGSFHRESFVGPGCEEDNNLFVKIIKLQVLRASDLVIRNILTGQWMDFPLAFSSFREGE